MVPVDKVSDWETLHAGNEQISLNVFGKEIVALRSVGDDWDSRFSSSGLGGFSATVESWYGWNPGDDASYPGKVGSGDVWDTSTGEQLRDPKFIERKADGTFYNPYHTEEE